MTSTIPILPSNTHAPAGPPRDTCGTPKGRGFLSLSCFARVTTTAASNTSTEAPHAPNLPAFIRVYLCESVVPFSSPPSRPLRAFAPSRLPQLRHDETNPPPRLHPSIRSSPCLRVSVVHPPHRADSWAGPELPKRTHYPRSPAFIRGSTPSPCQQQLSSPPFSPKPRSVDSVSAAVRFARRTFPNRRRIITGALEAGTCRAARSDVRSRTGR